MKVVVVVVVEAADLNIFEGEVGDSTFASLVSEFGRTVDLKKFRSLNEGFKFMRKTLLKKCNRFNEIFHRGRKECC